MAQLSDSIEHKKIEIMTSETITPLKKKMIPLDALIGAFRVSGYILLFETCKTKYMKNV